MPTATWKSRLRSGSAHCDLQLAVEVRQCPLGSGARGGGPAVPTGIWTARRRRRVRRRRRRRRRRALLKSSNPHLAGGEIYTRVCVCAHELAILWLPQFSIGLWWDLQCFTPRRKSPCRLWYLRASFWSHFLLVGG